MYAAYTAHIRKQHEMDYEQCCEEQRYHEEMTLQEEADHIAALASLEIERAIRICGVDMLNAHLTGVKVSIN